MTVLTQVLLFISYVILGLAVAILPSRLFGVSEQLAQLLGVITFFGAWQIQNLFVVRRIEKETSARVAVLEDVTTILRGDLERTRRKTEKGDEKSDEVVGELKMLHMLLTQLMEREVEVKEKIAARKSGMRKPAKRGGKAGIIEPTDEEVKQLGVDQTPEQVPETDAAVEAVVDEAIPESNEDEGAELELEDLELTPEEAALAVVDEGGELEPMQQDGGAVPEGVEPGADLAPAGARTGGRVAPKGPISGRKAQIRLIKREDQLLSVVRSSLAENRVDLYLQPIVGLPSRKQVHYECFSRVRDEEGRIILPRQYMRVAESKGLIGTIDNLLLFRLIQLVRRLGKRRPHVRFFCNMSRYSMEDEEFFPQFIDFMSANAEFRDRLVFEISQEDYFSLDGEVKDRLLSLGRKGFGFSMDLVKDFNKDFTMLGEHKFQFIKSDLNDLMVAHPEVGDVEAIKSFLRRHGMQLIASRIESEDDVLQALEAKVEYAQGYLFGEPTSSANLSNVF